MFSNIALAADEVAQGVSSLTQESTLMNFVPIILIFLIFYFLLIRPQVKKQKEQQALVNSVKRGDKVIIAGGIVGTYVKEEEGDIVEIELSKEVRVKALKHTITSVLNKDKNVIVPKDKPSEIVPNSKDQPLKKAKKIK